MLTDSEKKWLEERGEVCLEDCRQFFCAHCGLHKKYRDRFTGDCIYYECPLDAEELAECVRDAAEFEARVAAKLANPYVPIRRCDSCIGSGLSKPNANYTDCGRVSAECRLMHARLAVEEEMI